MSAAAAGRFTRRLSGLRPLLWRLPLLVFLAVGAIAQRFGLAVALATLAFEPLVVLAVALGTRLSTEPDSK